MKKGLPIYCFVLVCILVMSIIGNAFATGLVASGSDPQEIQLGEELQLGDLCNFKVNDFQFIDRYLYRDTRKSDYSRAKSGETYQFLFVDCSLLNMDLSERQIFSNIMTAKLIYDTKYEFDADIYQIDPTEKSTIHELYDKVIRESYPLGLLEEGYPCIMVTVPNIIETKEAPTDLIITLLDNEYVLHLR